jgi:hypothetical protein
MQKEDYQAYYWSGIAVCAARFSIGLKRLSLGDNCGLNGVAQLDAFDEWCGTDVGINPFTATRIENYVTALLAGSAAVFIRVQDARCHLKRSYGDAGLEAKFLREVWQCLQPESDRALSIVVAWLGAYDDGNAEATTRRLWHRAVRILRQPQHYQQLKTVAQSLTEMRQMTGEEVRRQLGIGRP